MRDACKIVCYFCCSVDAEGPSRLKLHSVVKTRMVEAKEIRTRKKLIIGWYEASICSTLGSSEDHFGKEEQFEKKNRSEDPKNGGRSTRRPNGSADLINKMESEIDKKENDLIF